MSLAKELLARYQAVNELKHDTWADIYVGTHDYKPKKDVKYDKSGEDPILNKDGNHQLNKRGKEHLKKMTDRYVKAGKNPEDAPKEASKLFGRAKAAKDAIDHAERTGVDPSGKRWHPTSPHQDYEISPDGQKTYASQITGKLPFTSHLYPIDPKKKANLDAYKAARLDQERANVDAHFGKRVVKHAKNLSYKGLPGNSWDTDAKTGISDYDRTQGDSD